MAEPSKFRQKMDKVANLLGAVFVVGPILLFGTNPGRDFLDFLITTDLERPLQCDAPSPYAGRLEVTYTFDEEVSASSVDALVAALDSGATRVELSSPGGFLAEGIRAYEAIRQAGASTAATGQCASACSLIFIAGQERCVGVDGKIGVHQWQSELGFSMDAESQLVSASLIDLIVPAGVSQDFYIAGATTPASSMHWLSPDELRDWNVITE